MHELIKIDLRQVLASKLGSKARFVPKALVRWLERFICADELNGMLARFYPKRGAEFCEAALSDLDVKVEVANPEMFPPVADRRVIFVCNHPLGGLDGVALIAELCRRYGPGVRFVVNDLLMAVEPLSDVFLPINKHGRQSREAIEEINRVMEGPDPVLVFPAGLVSRLGDDGSIRDLKWRKMFVSKALQHKRDVVPLHFSGENSASFYTLARRRKRLGLKFNIEMLRLPRELVGSRGKTFRLTVGQRLSWRRLQGAKPEQAASEVREMCYALAGHQPNKN